MNSISANTIFSGRACILSAIALVYMSGLAAGQKSPTRTVHPNPATSPVAAKAFDSPQQAADALVDAAQKFDVVALSEIFGPGGEDIIFSGEFAQDRKHAADFAAQAREKKKRLR